MPDWLLPRARQRQPVIRKVFSLAMIAFISACREPSSLPSVVPTGPAMKVCVCGLMSKCGSHDQRFDGGVFFRKGGSVLPSLSR
jgi:hypothetical protein